MHKKTGVYSKICAGPGNHLNKNLKHFIIIEEFYENSQLLCLYLNPRNSVFYVGVTNDLIRRVNEHKLGLVEGFTKKYGIKTLVYYEHFEDIYEAIVREKIIKKWKRKYKMSAIERMNPEWKDLYRFSER